MVLVLLEIRKRVLKKILATKPFKEPRTFLACIHGLWMAVKKFSLVYLWRLCVPEMVTPFVEMFPISEKATYVAASISEIKKPYCILFHPWLLAIFRYLTAYRIQLPGTDWRPLVVFLVLLKEYIFNMNLEIKKYPKEVSSQLRFFFVRFRYVKAF